MGLLCVVGVKNLFAKCFRRSKPKEEVPVNSSTFGSTFGSRTNNLHFIKIINIYIVSILNFAWQ